MPNVSPKHANDPVLVALGLAIRQSRLARQISQEELAHKATIDRSYLSSIERGGQNPGVITIARISAAMGMTLAELMQAGTL